MINSRRVHRSIRVAEADRFESSKEECVALSRFYFANLPGAPHIDNSESATNRRPWHWNENGNR